MKVYEQLSARHVELIPAQHVFFVASFRLKQPKPELDPTALVVYPSFEDDAQR